LGFQNFHELCEPPDPCTAKESSIVPPPIAIQKIPHMALNNHPYTATFDLLHGTVFYYQLAGDLTTTCYTTAESIQTTVASCKNHKQSFGKGVVQKVYQREINVAIFWIIIFEYVYRLMHTCKIMLEIVS